MIIYELDQMDGDGWMGDFKVNVFFFDVFLYLSVLMIKVGYIFVLY